MWVLPDECAVAGPDVIHDAGAFCANNCGPHHERLADVHDVVALLRRIKLGRFVSLAACPDSAGSQARVKPLQL